MNSEFNGPPEELRRVAEEIHMLRRDIQIASTTLGRIERRLKAVFPNYPDAKKERQRSNADSAVPMRTLHELHAIFNELVSCTQSSGDSGFSLRIGELRDEDVVALAKEVGVNSKSRLSRNKATTGVRKRVQEALQLQFELKGNDQDRM